MTRRQAVLRLLQFAAASPVVRADRRYADMGDPLHVPVNVYDFAKLAKAKLDPLAWDYLDEGSDGEVALRDSRRVLDSIILRPQFLLHDVSRIDISTTLFGKRLEHPFFLCPTGGKSCFFPNGEVETAQGAAAANTMMITGGAASSKGPKVWFQFTTVAELRTGKQMADFGRRLEDQGCSGVSVTVDIYHVSRRERSVRNGLVRRWCDGTGIRRTPAGTLDYRPDDVLWAAGEMPKPRPFATPTWDTLQRLRESINLPIIIKGVMTAEDTERARKYGMSGVVVSNHGARQLDQTGATIEALPECVEAAGGKMPVLIDGGFRRGTDILKALALGATAVGIARPYVWGLAAFGWRGVARVIELLRAEVAVDMGMMGVASIAQIDRSFVRFRK